MNKAIVALGSNVNAEDNILAARIALAKTFTVLRESTFRPTKPIDHPSSTEFLNGCVYLQTSIDLPDLRAQLKKMETELGRDLSGDQTSIVIDLDIIVWNDRVIDAHVSGWAFLKSAVLEILPGLKV